MDIEIEELDDLPEEGLEVEVESKKETEKPGDDPVEALRGELDRMRRERDDTSSRLQQSEQARVQSEEEARRRGDSEVHSHKALIEHAILAEQSRAELAESAYAEALGSGNYAEAAKIQRAMAQSEAKLAQLQTGLDHVNTDIEVRKNSLAAQPQPANGNVDSYISQFTKPSQDWLREHKDDIFSNKARGDLAYAGHIMALNSGIQPDTQEYFEYLDKHMGYAGNGTVSEQKPAKRQASPSAPPSKNPAMTGSSTRVAISAEERALAEEMGVPLKELAESKQAIASGRTHLHYYNER